MTRKKLAHFDKRTGVDQSSLPASITDGGTVVKSRAPVFPMMTAVTTFTMSCAAVAQGAWNCVAACLLLSLILSIWQIQIFRALPTLVFRETAAVSLYRRGIPYAHFLAGDLEVPEGRSCLGVVLLALLCMSSVLITLGNTPDLQGVFLPAPLSSVQRLGLTAVGVWFSLMAYSLIYLDFPRRKLLLRGPSAPLWTVYFADRKQRCRLLRYLRAVQLEKVSTRVGLEPTDDQKAFQGRAPFEPARERSMKW
jgi:hypothetical protein